MNATVEQLEALPEGAVVRSGDRILWTWIKRNDMWTCHELEISRYSGELWDIEGGDDDGIQILWPQPAPNHSMCARLVCHTDGDWGLQHPNGELVPMNAARVRALGYAVPDNRTAEQKVVDALTAFYGGERRSQYIDIAKTIVAELGLPAEDGERDD